MNINVFNPYAFQTNFIMNNKALNHVAICGRVYEDNNDTNKKSRMTVLSVVTNVPSDVDTVFAMARAQTFLLKINNHIHQNFQSMVIENDLEITKDCMTRMIHREISHHMISLMKSTVAMVASNGINFVSFVYGGKIPSSYVFNSGFGSITNLKQTEMCTNYFHIVCGDVQSNNHEIDKISLSVNNKRSKSALFSIAAKTEMNSTLVNCKTIWELSVR